MNDLRTSLARQAESVVPRPDVGDVARRVRRRARRAAAVRGGVSAAAVVAVVAVLVVTVRPGGEGAPAATPIPVVAADELGGIALVVVAGGPASAAERTIERLDASATTDGPTLVVRRPLGGGLGSGSVLPVGDRAEVPAGWVAVATGPARAPSIREARYDCEEVGEAATLGGLCYAGLTTTAGFEAALLRSGFTVGPPLGGDPTVVSRVGGGNATLAWEPRPGVVAYVGYSGSAFGAEQDAALGRLSGRARLLSPAEWAATGPQVVPQRNDW